MKILLFILLMPSILLAALFNGYLHLQEIFSFVHKCNAFLAGCLIFVISSSVFNKNIIWISSFLTVHVYFFLSVMYVFGSTKKFFLLPHAPNFSCDWLIEFTILLCTTMTLLATSNRKTGAVVQPVSSDLQPPDSDTDFGEKSGDAPLE